MFITASKNIVQAHLKEDVCDLDRISSQLLGKRLRDWNIALSRINVSSKFCSS